mmetsp:Transcript_40388/g.49816  ORF Transcript_40388/g.49816 Transcript_40388/m.49816 type:complete len:146 (+) Transcript_40388:42-479(+)
MKQVLGLLCVLLGIHVSLIYGNNNTALTSTTDAPLTTSTTNTSMTTSTTDTALTTSTTIETTSAHTSSLTPYNTTSNEATNNNDNSKIVKKVFNTFLIWQWILICVGAVICCICSILLCCRCFRKRESMFPNSSSYVPWLEATNV